MNTMDKTPAKVFLEKYEMYTETFDIIYKAINEAHTKKPSEKTRKLLNCLYRIAIYVNSLEADVTAMQRVLSTMRLDKNRAIERARRSEKELEEMKQKLNFKL